MDFFKKMFDLNISNESSKALSQKEQKEIDEIALLQDYINRYNLNYSVVHICRTLIFNGFSAKEAISIVNENKEYSFQEILIFSEFKKIYSKDFS